MLAASGVSPGHALRDLKALDPQVTIAAPAKDQDYFDPDNQKFLRNMQQRGRQVMIAESLARTHKDFDAFLEDKIDLDWEDQRRKIFQHFGLAQKDAAPSEGKGTFGRSTRQSKHFGSTQAQGAPNASRRSVFGRSGLEKSVIGTPGSGRSQQLFEDAHDRNDKSSGHSSDLRFLREKMRLYADKVQLLNSARLQARTFPVLHEFSEVEEYAGGDVCCEPKFMRVDFANSHRFLASFLTPTGP